MKRLLTLLPAACILAFLAFCVAYWVIKIDFAKSTFYSCLFAISALVATLYRNYIKEKNDSNKEENNL